MKKLIKCFLFSLIIVAIGCVAVGCTQTNGKDNKQNENEAKVNLSYETYSYGRESNFKQDVNLRIFENDTIEYEIISYNRKEPGYDKYLIKGKIETDKNDNQFIVFDNKVKNSLYYKNEMIFSKIEENSECDKCNIKKVGSTISMIGLPLTKNGEKNKESFCISEYNSFYQYDYYLMKNSKINNQKIGYYFYFPENENGKYSNLIRFDLKSAKPALDTSKTGLQTVELSNGEVKVEANIFIYDKNTKDLDYERPCRINLDENIKLGQSIDDFIKDAKVITNDIEIPITKNMISGYDSSKLGKQTITITCDNIVKDFEIFVYEGKTYKEICFNFDNSILFIKNNKTIDNLKKKIFEIGLKLSIIDSYQNEKIDSIEKFEIENFDPQKIGNQICIIKCCGLTKKIPLVVVESDKNPIIKIDADDVTIVVDVNDEISFEGKLKLIKFDGTITLIDVTKELFNTLKLEDLKEEHVYGSMLHITAEDGETFYDCVRKVRVETEKK